jgi:hypothetical protein
MRHGGLLLITAAVLACTACLGGGGKLEIRSTSNGLKAGREPVPFRIAEARGHLALGNIALALEGFRKAAREDPNSVEAQAGIASCYDRMGRFDLARRHYEMALALSPADAGLLAAFANSLDTQGLAAEAASVRREMAALATPATPAAPASNVAALPVPAAGEVSPAPAVPVQVATAPAPVPAAPEVAAPVGRSVTIALPPPRPVAPAPAAKSTAMAVAPVGRSVTIALAPPRPVPAAAQPPRLERLSLTEIALVTGSGPRWKRPMAPTVRMAAQSVAPRSAEVRLLNAARVDKLAARTRTFLGHFGWREIAVGDAAAVRARSLIVYPAGTQAAARRLSAKLGFAMAERANVRQVTVLLGRDAAVHPGLRPKA